MHRVAVLSHAYRAAPGYPHAVALVALQAPLWQRPQEGLLLFEALLALRIQLPKQLLEKGLVGLPTLEIVAATKDELVLYGPLQTVVPLFNLPVLMWTRRLRMPRVHPVVAQQCLIAFGEVFTALALQVTYRTAHRRVQPGRTCTAHERMLQAFRERLEALRPADRAGLPIGICQHKVKQQIRGRLPLYRYLQYVEAREVGLRTLPGGILPGRSRPPSELPPWPSTALRAAAAYATGPAGTCPDVGAATRQRAPFHLEAGIDFQKNPGFIPHLRERILTRAPCVGLLCMARHLAQTHIFARRSLAHASLGRCRCYGYILFHDQLEKKKDLLIGNHLGRGLAGTIRPSTPKNTLSPIVCNCRRRYF